MYLHGAVMRYNGSGSGSGKTQAPEEVDISRRDGVYIRLGASESMR